MADVNARPEPRELLYEGKAKQVFACDDADVVIVRYKDDATAFNAQKRGTVSDKGVVNNAVSAMLYGELEAFGVPTHFVEQLGARDQLVRRVTIVPVEVIVRNRAAGTFAKRYGVDEGLELDPVVVEWCYKSDPLGDPPMNTATAVALGLADEAQLEAMFDYAADVNDYLGARFAVAGLELVDFKLEFGIDAAGELRLADEISPDTCRLWDAETGEKLDKDRFRRDLGGVEEAYQEVWKRLRDTQGRDLELPEDDFDLDHVHLDDGDDDAALGAALPRPGAHDA
ncbi:MAG: phosphoribosylaminoimidazolesuccinocarboxamide synthase [Trueperaceae bacterium]|nr:MAG: phosphoribosylaminoimidazolesuccinocarboxamide synthase [Trueperaceae bacterium]